MRRVPLGSPEISEAQVAMIPHLSEASASSSKRARMESLKGAHAEAIASVS
jgi:hypothetical protein